MWRMLGLSVLIGFVPVVGHAADLTLVCQVSRSDTNGGQYRLRRKFEFIYDSQQYRLYDNFGSGFRFVAQRRYVLFDESQIVLQQNEQENSSIDRKTGDYIYQSSVTTVRGNCDAEDSGEKKF